MLIETSVPLLVRLESGDVRLRPGQPVWLDDADALKLLNRVPDKVRRVGAVQDSLCPVAEGNFVAWQSPLFTDSEARVLKIDTEGRHFLTEHPKTGERCWLPLSWIVREMDQA
jgi:hypothetical protein